MYFLIEVLQICAAGALEENMHRRQRIRPFERTFRLAYSVFDRPFQNRFACASGGWPFITAIRFCTHLVACRTTLSKVRLPT